jgi:hypothetical protein
MIENKGDQNGKKVDWKQKTGGKGQEMTGKERR